MLSLSIVTQIRNKMLNCRLFVSSLLKFVSKAKGMVFFFWGTCKRHDDKGTYVIIQQLLRCYGMLLTPQYLLSYHISTFIIMPFACSSKKKKITPFSLVTNFNREDTKSLQFNILLHIWGTIDRESMQHQLD